MQAKKIILLLTLFFSFQLSAMKEIEEQEQKIENVLIPGLSNDISQKILCLKTHAKPWENFDHLIKLKAVCKTWKQAIGTKKNIAKIFNIPPMHYAAMMNQPHKIIKLKLNKGCELLERNKWGHFPAEYAAACKSYKALEALNIGYAVAQLPKKLKTYTEKDDYVKKIVLINPKKQYTADEEEQINNDLKNALQENNFEKFLSILSDAPGYACINSFIEIAQSPEINTNFPNLIKYRSQRRQELLLLHKLSQRENPTQGFLQQYVEVNANFNACNHLGYTALHYIAQYPELNETLCYLIKQPNIKTNKLLCHQLVAPLHCAAEIGNLDTILSLLETKQCAVNAIDANNYSPIFYSVQNGHHECVNALIKKDADVTITLPSGKSLLHIAAAEGHAKILDILIPLLKNYVNHKDHLGRTPLTFCVYNNPENADLCIKQLINAGADVETRTNNEKMALLHYAANSNHLENAKALLEGKANVDALVNNSEPTNGTSYHGYTPLLTAAKCGHDKIVELLLQYGADTKLKTVLGKTALDLAQEHRDIELAKDDVPSVEEHKAKLAQYEEIIKILS